MKDTHLLLDGLQPVVGRRETVAVGGEPRAAVRFDERKGGLVLLPGDLQEELKEHGERETFPV